MTKAQLKKKVLALENKVYDAEQKLNEAMADLSIAATDILGYDVTADLCTGSEIEFRVTDQFGLPDSDSFIYMEDILAKIDEQ